MKKILIVDDEPNVHYSFRKVFSEEYTVISAQSGEEAINLMGTDTPDLVIMDIRMPRMDGLTTLKKIKQIDPKLHIIIMTAYGTMETAVEAMKSGAYDYTLKPFDINWMKTAISSALSTTKTMRKKVSLPPLKEEESNGDLMVGNSSPMQDIYKTIGQVAGKDITVLITGESGTGKELVARAIYEHSMRKNKQFMASYARRLNRTRGWFLEPFITWIDAYNVRSGNPSLEPEFIDSYEAGYQTSLGGNLISVEAYYRITHNKVEFIQSVLE